MFTWPLTVAHALQRASGYSAITELQNSDKLLAAGGQDAIRICVVGARQEATLPARSWQELQFLCPGLTLTLTIALTVHL